ncbi:MAG: FliM/FliN family flagellar motor switch protein [Bryobacteraceae bacterium]
MSPLEEVAHLADVPVDVSVELDRRILPIRQILEFDVGSVIKMTRSAGENIDILIGGTLVGFGEIVIIEDSVGVRITDFNGED